MAAAGGGGKDRYPWNSPERPATGDESLILARANVFEARLGGTTPVAMYPQGLSLPFGLMEMVGNVWEWMASSDERKPLRGGSWGSHQEGARVAARLRFNPGLSNFNIGLRVVGSRASG